MTQSNRLSKEEYKSTVKGFVLSELCPLILIFLVVPLSIASLIIWTHLD